MCSSKIPGDQSPSSPHEIPKEKNSPTRSPKVKRSSISPSPSEKELEIEGMVSSAKAEQKRIKLEKKHTIESGSKEELEQLLEQIQECFGVKPETEDDLNSIASFCFDKASLRLQSKDYVASEEIVKIFRVFFGKALKPICDEQLTHPLNLRAPHPVYVFKALFDCLEALPYPSFQDALQARVICLDSDSIGEPKTMLGRFIRLDMSNREQIRPLILAQEPNFENIFNNCPLYSTRDLFGSENIHSAYVLRDKNFQPKWIFKPTLEMNLEYGLLELNSADPTILSHREHLAHLLNFHSQFPIPATYFVEIKGFIGTVQLFIDNAQNISPTSDSNQISVEDFQKLLVFDLLFANCDRHEDNFLFRKAEEKIQVYGIDHDSCFCFDNRPLKIMILKFTHAFDCPFVESIENLVSEENIKRYTDILNEQEVGLEVIEWMIFVSESLRTACNKNEIANVVAKNLITEFSKRYVV